MPKTKKKAKLTVRNVCSHTEIHGGKFKWHCSLPPHEGDSHYMKPWPIA
jgi:hypothetical protein